VSVLRRTAVGLLFASCATPYAYRFEPVGPPTDPDLELSAALDPSTGREIVLSVHNLTPQPLQVDWAKIAVVTSDAPKMALRPETDLGWVEPGATLVARLSPFILPGAGAEAKALDGHLFTVEVPVTVLETPRLVRCPFVAHAQPL
jgi:hypothetical protein